MLRLQQQSDVKFDAVLDKKTRELIESPRTDQARSFVTKIWNGRFVQMNLTATLPACQDVLAPLKRRTKNEIKTRCA